MNDEIRVKIKENHQKEIFTKFINSFDRNFSKASNYLNISNSSLSKYKRHDTKYIPEKTLIEVINYLKIKKPEILEKTNLTNIRKDYIKKAHNKLEKKYGENWAKELTKRRDSKGISLSNFPEYIFVYLEENYRKSLFKAAYNLCGSLNNLSKIIKISPSRLPFWFYGTQKDYIRNKIGLQFIPLKKLKIISQKLVEDNRNEFSMKNIENNITMYRMRAGNPIKNPKFQINEGPEIVRLLFHLLGDGYAGGKKDNANYRNTCPELLKEFEKDLKIFGDVPIYKQKDSIKFPKVIAEIIEKFYEINTKTFDSKISEKIFQIPKRDLYQGIRAFTDDEGTIYSSSIRITSANKELIKGVKEIIVSLKIKCGEIKTQISQKARFGKIYYLDIKDIEKYYKHIGFTHPKKKRLLELYVKKKKSKRRKKLLKT